MADRDSPQFRRDLLAFLEIIRIDVPRTTPPEPVDFDFFDQHIVGDPAFRWEGSFVAQAKGELVGMTATYEGDGPEFLDQWITGVTREWRRKGLGQSLKAHSVRWAKANGVRTIRTSNESTNLGMLGMNERLGFVRKVGVVILGRRP